MGFELGPGFLRRPPEEWLPARAFPLVHRATVVANEQPGRSLSGVPVVHLTLDVLDGPSPRRVMHEFVWGPQQAKRYEPGRTIEIRVDPGNPDRVALMER